MIAVRRRRQPLSLGAVRLRKWRDRDGLTQVSAAARIGIDPWYFAKIERGRRVPGRSVSVAIERASAGAVDVADWDQPSPTRRAG